MLGDLGSTDILQNSTLKWSALIWTSSHLVFKFFVQVLIISSSRRSSHYPVSVSIFQGINTQGVVEVQSWISQLPPVLGHTCVHCLSNRDNRKVLQEKTHSTCLTQLWTLHCNTLQYYISQGSLYQFLMAISYNAMPWTAYNNTLLHNTFNHKTVVPDNTMLFIL